MPPSAAVETLVAEAVKPNVHAYQPYVGTAELREAFARWYARFYGVDLDPVTEIQPLVGSKEGILILSLAFLNKGDKVLVPDPGYPTYSSATALAEAELVTYDLLEENGWHPDFEALERMDLTGVKMMWVNYPNMPTGASATRALYERLVEFGLRHGIMICNDNPYSFILSGEPLSILAVPRAKECCVELNSLSKSHNMSGWRIGMVGAAAEVISEVLKVKSQMDSGMFLPLQLAAVQALAQDGAWYQELNAEYIERQRLAGRIFDLIGVTYDHSAAGLFLWGKVGVDSSLVRVADSVGGGSSDCVSEGGSVAVGSSPCGVVSEGGPVAVGDVEVASVDGTDCRTLGEKVSDAALYGAGVFITPGFIFGHNGEDYVRISLCASREVLMEAYRRLESILFDKSISYGK